MQIKLSGSLLDAVFDRIILSKQIANRMNIASLVLRVRPDLRAQIVRQLSAMPGVELPLGVSGGSCVVTVEDCDGHAAMDTLTTIHKLPGVIAVGLAYHFSDDDQTLHSGDTSAQAQEKVK
jgi:nitrate reductase NapAB chaperone NapD